MMSSDGKCDGSNCLMLRGGGLMGMGQGPIVVFTQVFFKFTYKLVPSKVNF